MNLKYKISGTELLTNPDGNHAPPVASFTTNYIQIDMVNKTGMNMITLTTKISVPDITYHVSNPMCIPSAKTLSNSSFLLSVMICVTSRISACCSSDKSKSIVCNFASFQLHFITRSFLLSILLSPQLTGWRHIG